MQQNVNKKLGKVRAHETMRATILFSIPAFFFIIMYIAYPIINSFQLSMTSWNGYANVEPLFVGLSNWKRLLQDTVFYRAFGNNIKVVVLSILVQLPMGIALSFMLDSGGRKLNVLKVSYFIPYLMSSVAVGLLFRYALDPYFGLVKPIMGLFGQKTIDLLGNPSYALYTIIGVICWQYIPFYMVYFLAALSSLSTEVYEAALIDGAKRSQYFFYIVLPLLKPTIKNACVLSLVGSLKYFDLIYVLTTGGPTYSVDGIAYGATELMATYMYKNAFVSNNMGYGSTVAMAMFIIVTALSSGALFLMNRKES